MNTIAHILFKIHSHGELEDPERVIYTEENVIKLLKYLGHELPDWNYTPEKDDDIMISTISLGDIDLESVPVPHVHEFCALVDNTNTFVKVHDGEICQVSRPNLMEKGVIIEFLNKNSKLFFGKEIDFTPYKIKELRIV